MKEFERYLQRGYNNHKSRCRECDDYLRRMRMQPYYCCPINRLKIGAMLMILKIRQNTRHAKYLRSDRKQQATLERRLRRHWFFLLRLAKTDEDKRLYAERLITELTS